ncbi:MAG: hypothetical protein HY514_03440 [Candidatus Aenigmarchaeota archaeon]|nr:hypothetical protein [Candidatus Aenigmarchaeota archaeon]
MPKKLLVAVATIWMSGCTFMYTKENNGIVHTRDTLCRLDAYWDKNTKPEKIYGIRGEGDQTDLLVCTLGNLNTCERVGGHDAYARFGLHPVTSVLWPREYNIDKIDKVDNGSARAEALLQELKSVKARHGQR